MAAAASAVERILERQREMEGSSAPVSLQDLQDRAELACLISTVMDSPLVVKDHRLLSEFLSVPTKTFLRHTSNKQHTTEVIEDLLLQLKLCRGLLALLAPQTRPSRYTLSVSAAVARTITAVLSSDEEKGLKGLDKTNKTHSSHSPPPGVVGGVRLGLGPTQSRTRGSGPSLSSPRQRHRQAPSRSSSGRRRPNHSSMKKQKQYLPTDGYLKPERDRHHHHRRRAAHRLPDYRSSSSTTSRSRSSSSGSSGRSRSSRSSSRRSSRRSRKRSSSRRREPRRESRRAITTTRRRRPRGAVAAVGDTAATAKEQVAGYSASGSGATADTSGAGGGGGGGGYVCGRYSLSPPRPPSSVHAVPSRSVGTAVSPPRPPPSSSLSPVQALSLSPPPLSSRAPSFGGTTESQEYQQQLVIQQQQSHGLSPRMAEADFAAAVKASAAIRERAAVGDTAASAASWTGKTGEGGGGEGMVHVRGVDDGADDDDGDDGDDGDDVPFFAVMKKHALDIGVQRRSLKALSKRKAIVERKRGGVVHKGKGRGKGKGVVLLDAMRRFPLDQQVQVLGLRCLAAYASGEEGNLLELASDGGMSVLLHALQHTMHPVDDPPHPPLSERAQGGVAAALCVLGNPAICADSVVRLDTSLALELSLSAMTLFPQSVRVLGLGSLSVANLFIKDSSIASASLLSRHGVPLIVTALTTCLDSPTVQAAGSWSLGSLAADEGLREAIVRAGGKESIERAATKFYNAPSVAQNARYALAQLSSSPVSPTAHPDAGPPSNPFFPKTASASVSPTAADAAAAAAAAGGASSAAKAAPLALAGAAEGCVMQ